MRASFPTFKCCIYFPLVFPSFTGFKSSKVPGRPKQGQEERGVGGEGVVCIVCPHILPLLTKPEIMGTIFSMF